MNHVFVDKNSYIEQSIIAEKAYIGKSVKIGVGKFAESKIDKKYMTRKFLS